MMSAGIDVRGYTIEDDRILFVCEQRGFKDMNKVRAFLLVQPETKEFEWNSKKSLPGESVSDDSDTVADDPMAKFQAMQEEAQQNAKREAKKKKKAAEAAKRKKEQAKKKAQAEKKKKKAEAEKKKKAAEEKKKAEEAAAAANQKTEL